MAITKATASSIAPAAKGDLVAGSATNDAAVLGVGANDTVLTADSSTATGLKWAAPAGGGGSDWTLLNAGGTNLSGSTVTISGISAKDKLFIILNQDVSSTNASATIQLRFNADSTAQYNQVGQGIRLQQSSYTAGSMLSAYAANSLPTDATQLEFALLTNNANSYSTGYCLVTGANSSGAKMVQMTSAVSGAGNNSTSVNSGGLYSGTSSITSVSVLLDTGTFDAGKIFVYTSN
jgi:hypothetical protein